MSDATKIMKRHPKNPLISPDDIPNTFAVFNPSPVMYGDKTILLLSVYSHCIKGDGCASKGIYIATSDDGIKFDIQHDKPFIDFDDPENPFTFVNGGVIDCRITKIEDIYYIVTPLNSGGEGPFAFLGKTEDFKTYTPIEVISLPPNRGASLFPEKINGKYYKLDRPSSGGGGHGNDGSIWLASSPDLIHWGCHRPLIRPGFAIWNILKVGPTPPIKTPEGWLEIIHGIMTWGGGCSSHYYIGAVLLDLENPEKVIGKMKSYLLAPEEPYEAIGIVNSVCFPCGAIGNLEKDELRLYYGAADKHVCLATGSLSEVVEACKKEI